MSLQRLADQSEKDFLVSERDRESKKSEPNQAITAKEAHIRNIFKAGSGQLQVNKEVNKNGSSRKHLDFKNMHGISQPDHIFRNSNI